MFLFGNKKNMNIFNVQEDIMVQKHAQKYKYFNIQSLSNPVIKHIDGSLKLKKIKQSFFLK